MNKLQRLFGELTKDLAPGVANPGKVVMERLLYRSAEDKSAVRKDLKGDAMAIESGTVDRGMIEKAEDVGPIDGAQGKDGAREHEMFQMPGFGKDDMAVDTPERTSNGDTGHSFE